MVVQLETKNLFLRKAFKVPIFGDMICIIIILSPAVFGSLLISSFLSLKNECFLSIYLFLGSGISLYLWQKETKVKVLWIPLWLILLTLGVLNLFGIR